MFLVEVLLDTGFTNGWLAVNARHRRIRVDRKLSLNELCKQLGVRSFLISIATLSKSWTKVGGKQVEWRCWYQNLLKTCVSLNHLSKSQRSSAVKRFHYIIEAILEVLYSGWNHRSCCTERKTLNLIWRLKMAALLRNHNRFSRMPINSKKSKKSYGKVPLIQKWRVIQHERN